MSWRDNLLDASFRGIPFKVSSVTSSFGRRSFLHQYANREKPYFQDLGKDAQEFQVEAYIIQNSENSFDYFGERDALINALEKKGSGVLVHPFLGIKKVGLLGKATLTESFEQGGMATFSMTFVEAGTRAIPDFLKSWISNVDNIVNAGVEAAGDLFLKIYNTTASFMDTVSGAASSLIGIANSAMGSVEGIATKSISQTISNINLFKNTAVNAVDSAVGLFNAFKNTAASFCIIGGMGDRIASELSSTIGSTVLGGVNTGTKQSDTNADSISITSNLSGGEQGQYSGVTKGEILTLDGETIPNILGRSIIKSLLNSVGDFDPSLFGVIPVSQESNFALLIDTMRFCFLSYLARIIIRTEFFSKQEALEYLEMFKTSVDDFQISLGAQAAGGTFEAGIGSSTDQVNNKEIYDSIEIIRNSLIENFLEKIEGIAKSIEYEVLSENENLLVLSYSKYKDITRYDEIFKRNKNKISHPGFLPGGETLEILSE